jgi:hypothetical protein
MLISSPIAAIRTIKLLFPYEMNGSGTPVTGSTPRAAKKFTVAWIRITEVMPAARSLE